MRSASLRRAGHLEHPKLILFFFIYFDKKTFTIINLLLFIVLFVKKCPATQLTSAAVQQQVFPVSPFSPCDAPWISRYPHPEGEPCILVTDTSSSSVEQAVAQIQVAQKCCTSLPRAVTCDRRAIPSLAPSSGGLLPTLASSTFWQQYFF